ncbi:MAG: hypothetical protein GY711_31850 [bacterium]|nr:hypothetical protein [bacterium]
MTDSNGFFQSRYREVTLASIVFGVIVGTIMNAAITYAGLKIGFTIVGSSVAAVLGFGVLRGVLRKGTILEVNIGQTVGSAVNTPNSGVIFTVPVLFLIGIPLVDGKMPNANFWLLTLACVTGAVLGCAFIIPLRKQMLDIERLRFPSATAVGAILKSPGAGAKKALILVISIGIAGAMAAPHQLYQITSDVEVAELDELVFQEKISYEDKLRTEMISGWIAAEAAPPEVSEHGLRVTLLETVRKFRELARGMPSTPHRIVLGMLELSEVVAFENAAATAQTAAYAVVGEATANGPYRVGSYPDDLAKRVFGITNGEGEWADLQSKKTGWAQKPMFGYADLDVRMPVEIDAEAGTVDYAFNGLGGENGQDPVLTHRVDRDGSGRPDLVINNTNVDAGRMGGLPDHMQLLFALAPFALGAGYLTGRAGLFVLAGGVLAYLIINPVLYTMGWMPASLLADQAPGFGYGNINRPLGIGLLLGGAMMGVIASFPSIKAALKSIASSKGAKTARDELGLKVLLTAVILGTGFLFASAYYVGGRAINPTDPVSGVEISEAAMTIEVNGYTIGFESDETEATYRGWSTEQQDTYLASIKADAPGLLASWGLGRIPRALIIALIGAVWIWFAGIIIAQCTGMTDWSPISGMALITVVLIMVLAGVGDQMGAVMIGASLCVAITCAADMMADLKTGYIVGAQPKRQQIVELISTGIGPVISMLVLLLIAAANMEKFGVPMGVGTDTTAPQAQALQAVIEGVRGADMPYALYVLGAGAGLLLGLGSFSGLGVLVGLSMYLPMNYLATYGIGCILNLIVSKIMGKTWAEEWGVPVAAGFIVGDALLGLSVNFIVLLQS